MVARVELAVLFSLSSMLTCSNFARAIPFFGSRMLGTVVSKYTTSAKVDTLERLRHIELLGEMDNWEDEGSKEDDPHPLRMQEWELEMRLSPWKKQVQQVKFDRNGTVSTSEGNSGEWWFDVGGLYWDVNATIGAAPTVFHHKAELHWNVFGSEPRMFRGTVTRDRTHKSFLPPWLFRPVVSSFVGAGVGDDTSDTSYRHRRATGNDEVAPIRVPQQTDRY